MDKDQKELGTTQLLLTFFKIGLSTIGGGYAMIPMMEHELVERNSWLEAKEFVDILALAQASPGVFAANMSSHIGYKLGGTRLAILCTLANILPSLIIVLLIAILFREFRQVEYIDYMFRAIRPVVVGLILAPVLSLSQSIKMNYWTMWLPLIVIVLICWLNISPIYIILASLLLAGANSLYLHLEQRATKS